MTPDRPRERAKIRFLLDEHCHHARFPRTRAGLHKLRGALRALAVDPPGGLGEQPMVWWLAEPAGWGPEQPVRSRSPRPG